MRIAEKLQWLVSCCIIWIPAAAFAQPDKDKDELSWDRNIRGLVDRYCTKCHNENKLSGDVNLAQDIDVRLILEHRDTWQTALTAIENADMPPDGAKQPSEKERQLLQQFLKKTLDEIDCSTEEPGKPVLRRLNRVEYDLAILDLTGLDLKLAEEFAPDATAHGFDHLGDVLSLSPAQVEQYHNAAKTIVAELRKQQELQPQLFRNVFGQEPTDEASGPTVARAAMERFATRAFRRPAPADYIDRLMTIYQQARDRQQSHYDAISHLVTAVLISPKFLMRVEQDQADAKGPYPVDDYELATRLSFFLWSRPPDSKLLELAAAGELSKIDVLERTTLEMLADERSGALVNNFFGQWLSLREISSHQPDASKFPEFNEELRKAMSDEIRGLLMEVVQRDRPITDLIDANYTYLNEPLAKHYGIDSVKGQAMQRVTLDDRRRGGLLTSAALLMLQSDPARTNVPRRGNFIAGRVLGTPPPPPPPNVPLLEDVAADGKLRSLRELLELHRSKPECASCHAKMDPLGFAMENYDAIGRWRTEDNGFAIDPSGMDASGRLFSGPVELKDMLLEQKEAFAKTLNKNLLIYALGRGLQRSDECVLRDVMTAAADNDYRFSSIVVSIVKSIPFRYRRNAFD